jgi:glycosyltransferase involved in cell wall biosynthesis
VVDPRLSGIDAGDVRIHSWPATFPAREAVTHGETGLLFRRGDIDDLAEQTLLAAGNPALRARIGRQARQYVERHHDIDRAVDQYMALLQLQCER